MRRKRKRKRDGRGGRKEDGNNGMREEEYWGEGKGRRGGNGRRGEYSIRYNSI